MKTVLSLREGKGRVLGPRFRDPTRFVTGLIAGDDIVTFDVEGKKIDSAGETFRALHVSAERAWFSSDGRLLLRTKEKALRELDVASGSCREPSSQENVRWDGGRVSRDGKCRVEAIHDGGFERYLGDDYPVDNVAVIRDRASGEEVSRYRHYYAVSGGAFLSDGERIVTATTRGEVAVWDYRTGSLVTSLTLPEKAHCSALTASPMDLRVAAALVSPGGGWTKARPLRLWDLASGEHHDLAGHEGPVNSLSFSPDGALLASCSDDGNLKLWSIDRVPPRKKPWTLVKKGASIRVVAFSPDGRAIISLSFDGHLIVWRGERPRAPLIGLEGDAEDK